MPSRGRVWASTSTGSPNIGRLWLGGVTFEGEDGLIGHSDGDVVCHAVADALLGAAALGDLGEHFPEGDPAFEGIEGRVLLRRVVALLGDAGFRPDVHRRDRGVRPSGDRAAPR